MARFHSPNTVMNGLIFYPDAENTRSYPGTGTTWTDLSTSRLSGTLTNGPVFNSEGYITFDGTDDYADFGNNPLAEVQDKTACAWIYLTANVATVFGIIDKDFDSGGGSYGGWGLWAYASSGNRLGFWAHSNKDLIDTTTAISLNTWYNVAVVWNSSAKSASFYFNGEFSSTKTDATIVEKASNTTTLKLAAIRTPVLAGSYFPGRIACASVYNRQLSADEIRQNYNALRGRFGL